MKDISKGHYFGICARVNCHHEYAIWKNKHTNTYYCSRCAEHLNEDITTKKDARRLYTTPNMFHLDIPPSGYALYVGKQYSTCLESIYTKVTTLEEISHIFKLRGCPDVIDIDWDFTSVVDLLDLIIQTHSNDTSFSMKEFPLLIFITCKINNVLTCKLSNIAVNNYHETVTRISVTELKRRYRELMEY
jgi:hypothetical protein